MLLRAARTSVSTATAASADALKQRVRELYLEQLLQRERPQGRTGQGWSRILKTAQDALENRLAELHCVDEIHAFALRCIKDDHLREVYLSFCVEDISEFALPAETVHNVVFSSEERPNFHKDLELFEQSKTPASSLSTASEATVPGRGSDQRFSVELKPAATPIDLE